MTVDQAQSPRIRAKVTQIHAFEGHRDAVYALAPAIDPLHFYSAGADGIVAEWSMIDGRSVRGILQAGAPVYSLGRASAGGTEWLFVGLNDGGVHFVNLSENRLVRSVKAHTGPIFDLLWLPETERLLALSGDGSFSVWNLDSVACELKVQVAASPLRVAVLSPDGMRLAIGGSDAAIRLFDALSLEQLASWPAHLNSVFSLAWTHSALLSGGRDARIKSWAEPSRPVQEIAAHLFAVNDLQLRPDGRFFATGSMDKTIKLWETESLRLIKVIDFARLQGHRSSVNRVLWLDGGRLLASVSDDRRVLGWDVAFEE